MREAFEAPIRSFCVTANGNTPLSQFSFSLLFSLVVFGEAFESIQTSSTSENDERGALCGQG